jgi:cytidine deaminase
MSVRLPENQEKRSLSSGLCAERVVLPFIQQQNFENGNHSSLIPTTTTPIPPCGSCRQSIAEYEINRKHLLRFILWEKLEIFINLNHLLPFMFDKKFL